MYDLDELVRFDTIVLLRSCGIPVREIKAMQAYDNEDAYDDLIERSYETVCSKIEELVRAKKRLEVVRKSRRIGKQAEMHEIQRDVVILEPIESIQGSFQSTARSVYELLSGTAETYPIADEGTFYLTRLSGETFFCIRVTDRSTTSLCFEKGVYLCYRFKGNLSLDGIL